jgi:small-conductance mechanosensitive channel
VQVYLRHQFHFRVGGYPVPLFNQMSDTLRNEILITCSTLAGGLIIYQLLFFFLKRWALRKKRFIPSILDKYIYYPGLLLMIVVSLWFGLLLFENHLDQETSRLIRHLVIILAICSGAFLLTRLVTVLGKITLRKLASETETNYSHRKAKTKFELIERILSVMIFVATLSLVLMTFKGVRQIGSTLLASAGVVGLIIGIAAQKSLGALFAGIQIAISQPIRLDDVVVVENQFGTIGEITLTYVVVNTWDGRRLVVPINFFLEKSFENWTRSTAEVIGKVTVHADYSLPVSAVRAVFESWVKASPLWDGRNVGLVVINATEKTIELRGVMSARNSGDAFELECEIREKLIGFIRENYPESLPKNRVLLPKEAVADKP